MRVCARATNTILDHAAKVVRLVSIGRGVVDTDICQATNHDQDICRTKVDLFDGNFGLWVVLEAMNILVAI